MIAICNVQDKLQKANSRAAGKSAAPASPQRNKLATSLRAELEVHKEALAASKEEAASLSSSLAKASSMIEVSTCFLWSWMCKSMSDVTIPLWTCSAVSLTTACCVVCLSDLRPQFSMLSAICLHALCVTAEILTWLSTCRTA